MDQIMNDKVKTYKNPDRNKIVTYKPYVPQYQIHDKEPREYKSAVVSSDTQIAQPSVDNPRQKRPAMRQPYAATTTSPVGRGRGPVPNVGNNMEHTWSTVDGEVIDDLSNEYVDPDESMIDNNDMVTDQALGYQSGITAAEIQHSPQQGKVTIEAVQTANSQSDNNDLLSIVIDLPIDSYLLIVSGVPVCSGPKEEVEDQVRSFIFGENEMCDGNPTPVEDIIVIKKSNIKVGAFLE
jgi:hypothetical protein